MVNLSRRQFLTQASIGVGSIMFGKSSFANSSGFWEHLRKWDFSEFEKYSDWIENIYYWKSNGSWKEKGAKINRILASDKMNLLNNPDFLENGNPQLNDDDLNLLNSQNHCGSFPKMIHLYYSYRRGLPAFVSKIKQERGGDIRYSYGNHPVRVVDSFSGNDNFRNFFLKSMTGGGREYNFVSGNFRTAPFLEQTDSVPIKIDRRFLKPGSVYYNADGHCMVVGKIDDTGEVHFLDSHPDHSITYSKTLSCVYFIESLKSDDSEIKKCFDGFRTLRFAKIQDGRAVPFTNDEMKTFGFSIEQYEKMAEIQKDKDIGGVEINKVKVTSYPQFVKARLKIIKERPLEFLASNSKELGNMFRDRESFVQDAWNDVLANGQIIFPNDSFIENIYQANGKWEIWSSPSSDVDRKNKYAYLGDCLEKMVVEFPNSNMFDYSGFNSKKQLAENLLNLKNKLFAEEIVMYKTSDGEYINLNLLDIEQRLFDLSFNPNHPPELRWGAPENSEERKGMKLKQVPLRTGEILEGLESYNLEKGLRYYTERQLTPTSLKFNDNPCNPPFELIDKRLKKYLVR